MSDEVVGLRVDFGDTAEKANRSADAVESLETAVTNVGAAMDQAGEATKRLRDEKGRFIATANAASAAVEKIATDSYELAQNFQATASAAKTFASSIPTTYELAKGYQSASDAAKDAAVSTRSFVASVESLDPTAHRAESSLVLMRTAGKKSADELKQGARESAYSMMMLGNTLDDLQYVPQMGLRPIINNIMQISPAIGIAMIGVDLLYKGLGSIGRALTSENTGFDRFSQSVADLKKKVDDLNGSWIKTTTVLRELATAQGDLKAAEIADKIRGTQGGAPAANAAAFGTAIKSATGGGNAADASVRQMVNEQYMGNEIGEIQEAVRNGTIPDDYARQANIASGNAGDIGRALRVPGIRSKLRGMITNQQTNAKLKDLGEGDQTATGELLKYIKDRPNLANSEFGQAFIGELEGDWLDKWQKDIEKSGKEIHKQLEKVDKTQKKAREATSETAKRFSDDFTKDLANKIKTRQAGRKDIDEAFVNSRITEEQYVELIGADRTAAKARAADVVAPTFEQARAYAVNAEAGSVARSRAFRQAQLDYETAGMGAGQSNLMRAMAGFGDRFNRRDSGANIAARQMAARQAGGRAAIEQRQRAMFEMQRIQNAEQSAQKRFVDVMEKIGRDGIEVKG